MVKKVEDSELPVRTLHLRGIADGSAFYLCGVTSGYWAKLVEYSPTFLEEIGTFNGHFEWCEVCLILRMQYV